MTVIAGLAGGVRLWGHSPLRVSLTPGLSHVVVLTWATCLLVQKGSFWTSHSGPLQWSLQASRW